MSILVLNNNKINRIKLLLKIVLIIDSLQIYGYDNIVNTA